MFSEINKIMSIMDTIEYGFKDNSGNNIINVDSKKWDEQFGEFYYLQTPSELLESKCGVCWDQVELERQLFSEKNINLKTYFIYILDDNMLPSHTFLTFEFNNKIYWFEHSWYKYRGIHEYKNENELLKDITNKFIKDHNEVSKNSKLYLYKYEKPKDHISCDDFYRYIETQTLIEIG